MSGNGILPSSQIADINFPATNYGDPDVLFIARRTSGHYGYHRPDSLRLSGGGGSGAGPSRAPDNHHFFNADEALVTASSPDLIILRNNNNEFSPSQRQSLTSKLSASYDRQCSEALPLNNNHCGCLAGAETSGIASPLMNQQSAVPLETSRWSLDDDDEGMSDESGASMSDGEAEAPCGERVELVMDQARFFCDKTLVYDSMPNLTTSNNNQTLNNDNTISPFVKPDPSSCLNLAFFDYYS